MMLAGEIAVADEVEYGTVMRRARREDRQVLPYSNSV